MIRLTQAEIAVGELLYPERSYWRPEVRADCQQAMRPCPYVGCRYHLYIDVNPSGNFRINFPNVEPWDLEESCALDVADRGDHNLEEIGDIMGITRERVRQIESVALSKLERNKEVPHERFEREPEPFPATELSPYATITTS